MHVYLHTRHPENLGYGPDTNSTPFNLYLILYNNCVHCTRTLVHVSTTLVPYLNKFTDYTKIIGQMALEYLLSLWYPLTLVRLINLSCLVTLSWWQVLLCLWLCCMVLAAVC